MRELFIYTFAFPTKEPVFFFMLPSDSFRETLSQTGTQTPES